MDSRPVVALKGSGELASAFPVTPLATAGIGAAAAALAVLLDTTGHRRPDVVVDQRLASLWFGFTIKPLGWQLPEAWDPIAGDYRTKDGWIRLHTNAPHHRAVAEGILGRHSDKQSMQAAVFQWSGDALESAIVTAGGCAAVMHGIAQWRAHPQGIAVAEEPLIDWHLTRGVSEPIPPIKSDRPLAAVKVLDLTRVLAGPVAGRFLAAFGAQVLRIDPPGWEEPGVVPEVTLGKRCAGLDLRETSDRAIFERLLGEAHILLSGYRPRALEGLGYDRATLHRINPGLIDVRLDAYGWSGPWADRRGFDSLVQMSSGIAEQGMRSRGADAPVPLPVQALDHATGYLMAAAAIKALLERHASGAVSTARVSLARTAKLLIDHKARPECDLPARTLNPAQDADYAKAIEQTGWGRAQRMIFPVGLSGYPISWPHPATPLRSSEPSWT